jgi:hypothetical protein
VDSIGNHRRMPLPDSIRNHRPDDLTDSAQQCCQDNGHPIFPRAPPRLPVFRLYFQAGRYVLSSLPALH